MTVYRLGELPNDLRRLNVLVHVQAEGTTRAWCGAGYNWPTDLAFSDEAAEVTCPDCQRWAQP